MDESALRPTSSVPRSPRRPAGRPVSHASAPLTEGGGGERTERALALGGQRPL